MAFDLGKLLARMRAPKPPRAAASQTPTFRETFHQDGFLPAPSYAEHLLDVFDTRLANDSRTLMQAMFKHDPDVSAAVNSYLTLANTPATLYVLDARQQIDRKATLSLNALVTALFEPTDYAQGFQLKPDLATTSEELRYMVLLRGACAAELVFDHSLFPDRLQQVDAASLEWREKRPGEYKPIQRNRSTGDVIDLDIPNLWVAFHRRDPTGVYPISDFVSAVNTIAARQLVINELYRILKVTGFPRVSVKIVEEVLTKHAPADVKADPAALARWLKARMTEIGVNFANLRSDLPFIHLDSADVKILDHRGAAFDITPVINTLNAQNQAALKTMPTVLGRGTSSLNASSVEARFAAMCADELNKPVALLLRRAFQFLLNVHGIAGFVRVEFAKAELRPDLELEPQRVMRRSRLEADLSRGLITDDEYHMMMYRRPRPEGAPELSGTGFLVTPSIDASKASPNGDPLGRALASPDSNMAESNSVDAA